MRGLSLSVGFNRPEMANIFQTDNDGNVVLAQGCTMKIDAAVSSISDIAFNVKVI